MRVIRTNLPPGLTVLLVLLGILFAFIVVPILLIIGLCWLVFFALTGKSLSPAGFLRWRKERRHRNIYEGHFQREDSRQDAHSAANDDTIECEVISARTLDENGQEIR